MIVKFMSYLFFVFRFQIKMGKFSLWVVAMTAEHTTQEYFVHLLARKNSFNKDKEIRGYWVNFCSIIIYYIFSIVLYNRRRD